MWAGGTPAFGRRQSEALIQKHKHHLRARCLCFWISVSLNRAKRGPASPRLSPQPTAS
jgi:hypothetical protein